MMNRGLTDEWDRIVPADLKDKLGIYGSGMSRAEAWRDAIGTMDPATFYKKLTRDLPGQTTITIEAKGGGSSKLTLACKDGRTTLFAAKNHMFHHPAQQKIHLEKWRAGEIREGVTTPFKSGTGIGTILLENQLGMMKDLGFRYLTLRAGDEDGAKYWSRRGFKIEENGPYIRNLVDTVRENYEKLKPDLSPEKQAEIETILTEASPYANVKFADIEGMVGDKALSTKLLYGANPRCVIDTQDEGQMDLVRSKLMHTGDIRKNMKDQFPAPPPQTQPSPSSGLYKASPVFDLSKR